MENQNLIAEITALATGPEGHRRTEDMFGNVNHWFRLDVPESIVPVAGMLAKHGTRLAMVTAYNRMQLRDPVHEVCYHMEFKGVLYHVTVLLDEEHHSVPSITPIFPNADWHERELMELYSIEVVDHPNPRRLFLDEQIDEGILGEAVPLSIMMNGACTVDLWERILRDRARAEAAAQESRS